LGTKSEMQRLMKDAEKMTGEHYTLGDFGDTVKAIHAVQQNLNITGTTAKEASTTLSGSFSSMKAAFSDFLGNMALGENIKPSLNNLLTTVNTFIFGNLLPLVGNIGTQLVTFIASDAPQMITQGMTLLANLSTGLRQGIPVLASSALDILQSFAMNLATNMPVIIEKGFEMLNNLVDGIINALPEMITRLPAIIKTFADVINTNMPTILQKGAELLLKFVKGILSCIPVLIANMPQIVQAIVSVIQAFNWLNLGKNIIEFFINGIKGMLGLVGQAATGLKDTILNYLRNLPSHLGTIGRDAITFLGNAISGLTSWVVSKIAMIVIGMTNGVSNLPSMLGKTGTSAIKALGNAIGVLLSWAVGKVTGIGRGMVNALSSSFAGVGSIGSNLVKGLWNGISNMGAWIKSKISGFGKGVLNSLKSFFGIHSPSTLMRDEIGVYLGQGIGVGIEQSGDDVKESMKKLVDETMDIGNGAFDAEVQGMVDYDVSTPGEERQDVMSRLERIIVLLDKLSAKNYQIVLDSGILVAETAEQMDEALNKIRKWKAATA